MKKQIFTLNINRLERFLKKLNNKTKPLARKRKRYVNLTFLKLNKDTLKEEDRFSIKYKDKCKQQTDMSYSDAVKTLRGNTILFQVKIEKDVVCSPRDLLIIKQYSDTEVDIQMNPEERLVIDPKIIENLIEELNKKEVNIK